jgi:hypothetical protein
VRISQGAGGDIQINDENGDHISTQSLFINRISIAIYHKTWAKVFSNAGHASELAFKDRTAGSSAELSDFARANPQLRN